MNRQGKASSSLAEKDRLQLGRDQIEHLSHKHLGQYTPSKKRQDPIATLQDGEKDREARLLPVKYARMLPNAFTFFRGSAGIMAADLAAQPHTKLVVQLCGDAHLQNLGCFASPDGRVVFDINDFDETVPGPWEWDVKRMATSILLAGAVCKHDEATCGEAADAFSLSYCHTIAELANEPTLVAARHLIHRLSQDRTISAAFQQAERARPLDLLRKYATEMRGHYRFKRVAGEWPLSRKDAAAVLRSLAGYRRALLPERLHFLSFYHPVDVAFKIVGTGSVGLRDYIVLLEGRDPRDAIFLQIKQEAPSVYAPFLRLKHFDNQGERVVQGQRRIQPLSDLLLGWTTIGPFDYLVRQLNDHKGSLDIRNMRGKGLRSLAQVAGELLARGHARSGDPLAIRGYIGDDTKVQKSIVKFARSYAEQVGRDFSQFRAAITAKKIKVASAEGFSG